MAAVAVAVLAAGEPGGETLAVKFDAFGVLAVAGPVLIFPLSVDHLFKFKNK